MRKFIDASGPVRKIGWRDRLTCWWIGHNPDLAKCHKVDIPTTAETISGVHVIRVGRTFHFGPTNCLRCETPLEMKG